MPKKQSTAAKKARAVQRQGGGKHTALLAAQTCSQDLDPWSVYPGTCARAPHSDLEPCSPDRDFDVEAWRRREAEAWAAGEARWAALTPEQRAEEEELAREQEYDDGGEQPSDWIEYQED